MSHRPPHAGHLFDLSSLSGRAGFTAAYSEKGLVYLSVCGDNENCANGVGERGLPSTPPPPAKRSDAFIGSNPLGVRAGAVRG